MKEIFIKKPIPLGGLGIYISFMLVIILKPGALSPAEKGILIGATFIIIGGFIDDVMEIKPWQKLIFNSDNFIFNLLWCYNNNINESIFCWRLMLQM